MELEMNLLPHVYFKLRVDFEWFLTMVNNTRGYSFFISTTSSTL
jgi:hypothetical protein